MAAAEGPAVEMVAAVAIFDGGCREGREGRERRRGAGRGASRNADASRLAVADDVYRTDRMRKGARLTVFRMACPAPMEEDQSAWDLAIVTFCIDLC